MAKKKSLSVSVKPYAEAERPVKAVSEAAAVGLSNTLPTYSYSICLDYVKFRFDGEFDFESKFFKDLLTVLKVKPFLFEESKGNMGYKKKLIFDENVIFQYGGDTTKNGEGNETWLLEMSGSSCRDFDERLGNWVDFLSHCLNGKGRCTRIDVAIDDFTGNISVDEIKYRIRKGLFSMPMRSWKMHGGVELLSPGVEKQTINGVDLIQSHNDGFTADFGTKYSKQLSIYNKRAERMSKEYAVFVNSWLRYEGRFFKESAVSAVNIVLASMQNGSFQSVAAGLIRGLVEFKEKNNENLHNRARAPIWRKWDEMLNHVEKITFVNQAKIETSLARKHEWLLNYAGKTLTKALLANPGKFEDLISFIFRLSIDKLDKNDIASINKLRRQAGKPDITPDFALGFVKDNYEENKHDTYIKDVFYRYL